MTHKANILPFAFWIMNHFECRLNRRFWRSKKVVQVVQIGGRGGGYLDIIQKKSNFFFVKPSRISSHNVHACTTSKITFMFSLFADAVNLQYPYHPHQMTNRPIVGANDVYERTISLRIFPTMPDDHDHDDDEHDEDDSDH